MDKNSFFLKEIKKIQTEFRKNNLKVVVGGGFAIDGFLGRITREHGDLDLDIVGNLTWIDGFKQTEKILKGIYKNKLTVNNRRFEVKLNNLKIDLEYVQDLASGRTYRYLFGSGNYKFPLPFYLYGKAKLRNVVFDIENPHFIFAIKFLMPISGEKQIRKKDKKDIENLIPSLNKGSLIKALRFQLNYLKNRFKNPIPVPQKVN